MHSKNPQIEHMGAVVVIELAMCHILLGTIFYCIPTPVYYILQPSDSYHLAVSRWANQGGVGVTIRP